MAEMVTSVFGGHKAEGSANQRDLGIALIKQTVRKRKRGFGVSPAISIYQSAPAS